MQKKYHLIAVGGSVMHNVAIDLKDMGHIITGSDDEIYEPSRSRLQAKSLLPEEMGWHPEKIDVTLDAVILGKHARIDNPELKKAQELGIPIYSFPEFISKHSKAKRRVCIAGSHGKTSTTAMIMHVLRKMDMTFDYLVGAKLDGFEKMVKISDADVLICEGDEYPSSALDNRAKMLHYNADISVITGMAWDHVNIYKTYESYKDAFRRFLKSMPEHGVCFFDQSDEVLNHMMQNEIFDVKRISYDALEPNKKSVLEWEGNTYDLKVFGRHNMLNMNAARLVCAELGVSADEFFNAMSDFKGAAKRLELISENKPVIYRDFAHAPSKCQATVEAVRSRYGQSKIKAILELHTFSSLDQKFIKNYKGTMNNADEAIVFYDEHALKMKKMPELEAAKVANSFDHAHIEVISDPKHLAKAIKNSQNDGTEVLLIMSSGSLAGIDLNQLLELQAE